MTKLLKKAFDEASKLPEKEQNALASILLEELASERRWEELFAGSHDLLGQLADKALAEHRAGRTEKPGRVRHRFPPLPASPRFTMVPVPVARLIGGSAPAPVPGPLTRKADQDNLGSGYEPARKEGV